MVVDLRRYKLAKVLISDLQKILDQYESFMYNITNEQVKLNKWGQYKSPNLVAYRMEELKHHIQLEIYRLKKAIELEKDYLKGDKK